MPVAQTDEYKVLEIKTLGKDRDAEARQMLERVAKQVQPIMRKRQWTVRKLSEFVPRSPNLLGLNVNRGQEVKIRLRPAGSQAAFYDWNHVLGTMLHELCHNRIGPHNAEFYKLLDDLWTEAEELMDKGITGTAQGFDAASAGRLGAHGFIPTHNPPEHKMADAIRKAAEARARQQALMPSGPCKLGGSSSYRHMTPAQAAAAAAERRARDNLWLAAVLALGLAAAAVCSADRLESSNARAAWPLSASAAQGSSILQASVQASAVAAEQQQFVLDTRNIVALMVAFLVASLAASAGVGGGAFFVPLAMVCLSMSLKEATVLSQASIAAVSLASIGFNLRKRHPLHPDSKTLIDYEMCLTMTPALLLGVSIGVLFNAAFPTWLITSLLIAMLAFMSVKTGQKGASLWRTDTTALQRRQQQQQQQQAPAANSNSSADAGVLPVSSTGAAPAAVVVSDGAAADADVKPRRAPYPWSLAVGVLLLWVGFSGLQLLRQTTERCSPAYFAVTAAEVVFGAGASLMFAYYCIARPARQQTAPDSLTAPLLGGQQPSLPTLMQQQQQHMQQSMQQLSVQAAKVAAAGVLAGVLGIGGGMLMAPMMLAAGVHPQAASATSNILVFFCSSSATLAFFLAGRVNLQLSAVYCLVCGVASLVGLTLFGRLVKASGRPSIVVLLLAFIMVSGAVCSGVFGYLDAWRQWQEGTGGWKSVC
ncbi:hypothetical protein OEZ86_011627 [Tetradesmus obliquus]|nr:hypothetical protein OEZ86_011627 [Tetradesmus obliquus]